MSRNLAQCLALTVIQVWAATELAGVLSVLLWVIAARNALIFTATVYGLAKLAAKQLQSERNV